MSTFFIVCCALAWAGCSRRPTPEIRLSHNDRGEVESILFLGRNVTDADLQLIKQHPGLKAIALQECGQVSDRGFAALAEASELAKLSVIRVPISDAGLVSLAPLKGLADVELAHTEVQGEGLKHLAELPLTRLVITSRKATKEGLQALAQLAGLRELELDCKELKLADIGALAELKQLESLVALPMPAGDNLSPLRGLPLKRLHLTCEEIGDESVELLNTLKQLEDLQLTSSQIGDAGLKELTLPQLTKLSLSNCVHVTDAALANLQGLPKLETLFIGGTAISGRDLTPLAPLRNLKGVLMNGDQFKGSQESIDALKKLLPNCEVVILRG